MDSASILSIVFTLIALAVGSLVTWFVSHRYYVRAARELNQESAEIRNLLRIVLQAMEDAKMVTLNRKDGKITGMHYSESITFAANLGITTAVQKAVQKAIQKAIQEALAPLKTSPDTMPRTTGEEH